MGIVLRWPIPWKASPGLRRWRLMCCLYIVATSKTRYVSDNNRKSAQNGTICSDIATSISTYRAMWRRWCYCPVKIDSVKIVLGEGEGKVLLEVIAKRAKKYQPKPKITYKMIQDRESHDFNRGRISIIVYQRRSDQGRWRLDIILEYKEANWYSMSLS